MPELTVIHIAVLTLFAVIGAIVGWLLRGKRSTQEKAAINASWQEQIDAQRSEDHRLAMQNKRLMDQISQFQASSLDAKQRAKELSTAMIEASTRRDELQREIKEIRGSLEVVANQRDSLQTDVAIQSKDQSATQEKDEKIFQLSRELENWQDRLPPLIDRYKDRDQEAIRLEAELAEARLRIEQLESSQDNNSTAIEPVRNPDTLTDGRGASNDPSDSQTNRVGPFAESGNDGGYAARRDDLQQIKGVGPAIEKTLYELGIHRFQQIANMSEYDIDRVSKRLKGFHSRIYREDWIGQARELNDRNNRG